MPGAHRLGSRPMHTVALQLAPILGAEKSKVPFFIAGGALVVWALFLSLALGMRKPEFPGGLQGQRIVSAITAVLGATPTFAGGTRVLTLKLKPGKYAFYCSVPGHRQGGMEGTLTVS